MVSVSAGSMRYDWDPAWVNPLFVVGTIGYLALLERLIPYERAWQPSSREWRWYGAYFLLTAAGGGLGQAAVVAAVGLVARPEAALPLWWEIPAALLLASLANYLVHRLSHSNPWLWRLHGVHHVPDKVNVGNNGVNHILDVVLTQGCVQLSLALVGFSADTVLTAGLFAVAQGYFCHANIDVRIGVLNHVLAGPEQHRLHHSVDLSEAGHFGGDLSVWDRAFGSFTWHPDRAPVAVGLHDPATFPETGAIGASLLHPWRGSGRGRG
ncbi:sterol desaturase family protein [Streptomyces sp. XD-27]|uniref:sterol desaturase family protein n=1 Tax=Streptomyces sp. XD-27 TaxID=3062779 RepID=UPI0026F45E92|nr:sterol desaturase family protein [Streptomyces sp. XD-27]WKX74241.1 sterol desaturase family protein [Streptomyces sp. XD-27]